MSYDIFSDLPHVARKLLHEPWLILPAHHLSMVEQLEAHRSQPTHLRSYASVDKKKDSKKATADAPPEGQLNPVTFYDQATGLAVLAVEGTIGKKLGWLETMCGGFDLNALEDGLSQLADLKPTAVQLYLDTPGGTVTGIAEAAAMIEDFAATVAPVHAYVDIMCCSAGQWLASGATTCCAAPSALLGSIGVYNAMFDTTARYAAAGTTVHRATSGPLKGAGIPGTRPTDRQLEAMQAEVTRLAQDFYDQMNRSQATAGRPPLDPATHFTGGTFRAGTPTGAPLVDAILPSRQNHMNMLATQYARRTRRAA